MIKIGDFSKLAMVSVRMLRYYDEHGLLSPVEIDKFTGYRYYNAGQLSEISSIKLLKGMGVSLSEIKMLKDEGFDRQKMLSVLKKCYEKNQNELSEINLRLKTLEKTICRLERNDFMPNYNVVLKTMPKRNVVSLREKIARYQDEGDLWKKLYSNIAKNGIKLLNPCYPVSVYMDNEYKEAYPGIEVQVSVDGEYEDTEQLKFKAVEEMQVISVTFTGEYDQITEVYSAMAQWIETNNYDFNGNMFLIYIKSPSEAKSSDEYVSELCIPVRKI